MAERQIRTSGFISVSVTNIRFNGEKTERLILGINWNIL